MGEAAPRAEHLDRRAPVHDPSGHPALAGNAAPHELAHFTPADGAGFHCQSLAQRLLTARVYAWLTTWLQRTGH